MQKKLMNHYFILIWFGSLSLLLIQNVMCTAIPLFLQELNFSPSFIGALGIPFAVLGILARLSGGYLMDRFSRRAAMLAGTLLMGLASLLLGLFPIAALLFLFRGLHGAGFALGQAAFSTASIDVTPKEKSSLGVGIFWMSTALSMACTGYLIQFLTNGGSYRPLFPVCFLFGLLGSVFALLCKYERNGHRGLPSLSQNSRGAASGWRRFLEPAAARSALVEFFVMLGVSCPNIFILAFAESQGYTNSGIFLLISAISMAISNLSSNSLMKKMGAKKLLTVSMAASGILISLMVLCPGLATYCFGGVGFGMAQGFSFPILTVLAVEHAPENRRGTANSTMLMAGDLGMGIGTFLWGSVIDFSGYLPAYGLAGAALLISGLLAYLLFRSEHFTEKV